MFELAKSVVTLQFDTGPFDRQMNEVEHKVHRVSNSIAGIAPILGGTMGLAGAAVLAVTAGFAATVKVAGDLEQTYTTLSRVTGLTADETKRLADSLKNLSTTKPGISLEEINKIAEFAGRMGVGGKTPEGKISGITKVASDLADLKLILGDMDIEETSTRMIRILNVFGLGVDQLSSFGSALVAVDNASTATGTELLEMVNRMQGMGVTLGATIPQLTALAGVMRDAGVEVDSGSTAISQLGFKLTTKPQAFADAVRMTGTEARKLAQDIVNNPVKAIGDWMAALKRMDSGSQMKALASLHMTGRMSGQILLQLAQKMGDVTDMLAMSNEEWETQKSLQDGVAKSSQTVWAQMSLMGNQLKVAAANVGEYTLPVFGELVGVMGDVGRSAAKLMGEAMPALAAWSKSSVAAIRDVRDWFKGMSETIDGVTTTFKLIAATWSSTMEEASLRITKGLQTVGYGFSWVVDAAGSLWDWFSTNWETMIADAISVVIGFAQAVVRTFSSMLTGVYDILTNLGSELGEFLADPLHHEMKFDVEARVGQAINEIAGAFTRENIMKGVETPTLELPGWNPEVMTGKLDELIKAVREKRDNDMLRIANELANKGVKKPEPAKTDGPPKQIPKRQGGGVFAAGEGGKSFGLEEFRKQVQDAIGKGSGGGIPEQQLALARQEAAKRERDAAEAKKVALTAATTTNSKLDSLISAVKNPAFTV